MQETNLDLTMTPEKSIRLPPGSHRLQIHYTAFDHVAPDKVRFNVRMQGKDSDWMDVKSQPVMYYHDLAPGKHCFEVRARNSDGVASLKTAALVLKVEP